MKWTSLFAYEENYTYATAGRAGYLGVRPTYLAYLYDGPTLRTVLLHPTSGARLGELPDDSPIHTLQELHFNVLAGDTGK